MDTILQMAALTALLASGPASPAPVNRSLLDLSPATRSVMEAQSRRVALSAPATSNQPRQRRDSVINGTLIGAAAGFAAGLVAVRVECGPNDGECTAIARLVYVPVFSVGGAVLGALIDRAIH